MASNFSAVLRVGIARVLGGPSLGSGVLVAYSIKAQLLARTAVRPQNPGNLEAESG